MDSDFLVEAVLRWCHVISGITWIGILYFFNMINGPFQSKLSPEAKKEVVPQLMPRALWWFRWGAMFTLIFGLALFVWIYMYYEGQMRGPEGGITDRALMIMIGMFLAIIMWFNVWFIIWPAQKKIIAAVRDGQSPPGGLAKRAMIASRYNTYSSGPMLFLMVGPQGYGTLSMEYLLIAFVGGLLVMHLAIKAGPKVGTSI